MATLSILVALTVSQWALADIRLLYENGKSALIFPDEASGKILYRDCIRAKSQPKPSRACLSEHGNIGTRPRDEFIFLLTRAHGIPGQYAGEKGFVQLTKDREATLREAGTVKQDIQDYYDLLITLHEEIVPALSNERSIELSKDPIISILRDLFGPLYYDEGADRLWKIVKEEATWVEAFTLCTGRPWQLPSPIELFGRQATQAIKAHDGSEYLPLAERHRYSQEAADNLIYKWRKDSFQTAIPRHIWTTYHVNSDGSYAYPTTGIHIPKSGDTGWVGEPLVATLRTTPGREGYHEYWAINISPSSLDRNNDGPLHTVVCWQ